MEHEDNQPSPGATDIELRYPRASHMRGIVLVVMECKGASEEDKLVPGGIFESMGQLAVGKACRADTWDDV